MRPTSIMKVLISVILKILHTNYSSKNPAMKCKLKNLPQYSILIYYIYNILSIMNNNADSILITCNYS